MKAMLKEEDDDVADDPLENGVLIEKSGNTPITCFQIPDDWKPNKKKAGETDFKDVDNPGAWPEFCYKASFNLKDEYTCHKTPTGATPVPLDDNGWYFVNGWKFHSQGWKDASEEKARHGATYSNLFSDSRKGKLDHNMSSWLGMGPEKIKQKDALWFDQLLLLMCAVSKSGIRNDPCKTYYSKVEKYSNIYAAQFGLGRSYSKKFDPIKIDKLVQWDGIILH
eukprot:3439898-Ditylum_brightwellii.AAC.1